MNEINVLDKLTIDKIAAGEVIERPLSIVKELMENSIDSGATMISVEIADGGISLIRVSDNGSGIDKSQIRKAFLRHSTSKITSAEDLSFIHSLGFRGEALSSICAVAKVELCTKTADSLTGIIYKIYGGEEVSFDEAGLPNGTTVVVRDVFYNTPARLKFLKTPHTEGSYIADIVSKIAISHPEIAIKFISNKSIKINTSGNGILKDAIYAVYGRDITSNLLEVNFSDSLFELSGFIGKPELARANRSFELMFVNGRFVKDRVIAGAVEEAFKGYQMKGTFPFAILNLKIEPELVDVNVHPAKSEIRFYDNEKIYNWILEVIKDRLKQRENIPAFTVSADPKEKTNSTVKVEPVAVKESVPEPFENQRISQMNLFSEETEYNANPSYVLEEVVSESETFPEAEDSVTYIQTELFDKDFLSQEGRIRHRLIGEVFDTYWLVEFNNSLYIIDQHAAHEKVLYEEFLNKIKNEKHYSQNLMPSFVVTLSASEEATLNRYQKQLEDMGFEIRPFGGSEYAISAVPADLYTLDESNLFLSFLDELGEISSGMASDLLLDRIASAACKAAVKGGNKISFTEANSLIDRLLQLDNPYNCPHGRPTIIQMSKSELERKFKRLL